jgi:hypothetical protein
MLMKISSKPEITVQCEQILFHLRKASQEAVADDSEGIDPEQLFDRLESNHPDIKKRLGVLDTPGFVLSEAFKEPLPEDELRLWNGGE